jgi:hypothetical protein
MKSESIAIKSSVEVHLKYRPAQIPHSFFPCLVPYSSVVSRRFHSLMHGAEALPPVQAMVRRSCIDIQSEVQYASAARTFSV